MEFTEHITIDHIICLFGIIILACWLLKTSLGVKALADSVPRRNNMPVYLPLVPLFIWFGAVWLAESMSRLIIGDLKGWQSDFLDNIIFCISEITAIIVIIFLARAHFARRLKGFGLNVKTIVRDFFAAFVNLLTVWPVMLIAITLTMLFGELIRGEDYQIQRHEQLTLIAEYSQLPLRILIIIVAVVIAPILEELLFRGFFQTTIRSFFKIRNGAWPAIGISSVLFTTIHVNAEHWPALFVLGVCLGYAYEKSGSLFRPIFIHSLFNATSIIAALS